MEGVYQFVWGVILLGVALFIIFGINVQVPPDQNVTIHVLDKYTKPSYPFDRNIIKLEDGEHEIINDELYSKFLIGRDYNVTISQYGDITGIN